MKVTMEERARRAVRACMVVGTECAPEFHRTSSMGVDDKWWFAVASLEGPPSRKDGNGDMLR